MECSSSLIVKFHLQSYTDFMSNTLYKCTLFMHLKWPSDSCFHITSQWFDRLFHFCKKSRHIESWHRARVWKEREKCKSIRETHEQVIILIATWKIQIQKQSENDHCDEKEMAKLQRAQQKAMYFIWSHRVSLEVHKAWSTQEYCVELVNICGQWPS